MERFPRGRPVPVRFEFDSAPEEVFFSFMKPGVARAVVDPGSRHPASRIEQLDEAGRIFQYVVDTRGFRSGIVRCHMWSESGHVDSDFYEFEIKEAPAQLL